MSDKLKIPYTVEVDDGGCKHCGHGQTWTVYDPDGIAVGTSWEEMEDAAQVADRMNEAYVVGMHGAYEVATTDRDPIAILNAASELDNLLCPF